mgnify:CR=1 FL=1
MTMLVPLKSPLIPPTKPITSPKPYCSVNQSKPSITLFSPGDGLPKLTIPIHKCLIGIFVKT